MAQEVRKRTVSANGGISTSSKDEGSEYLSELQKDLNRQRLRDRTRKLRSDMVGQLEGQINSILEEFMTDVEVIEDTKDTAEGKKGSKKKPGELPDKVFVTRRSVLTDLLEISHIRTIYHIFIAILILFSLNTLAYELIENGRLNLDFELISWSFGKFPIVMSLWTCMNLSTLLILYPSFQYWANFRKRGKVGWQDYIWLALLVVYQVAFLVLPVRVVYRHLLPPVSSVIIVCEQIRLLMKAHAFIRHNIPRVLQHDPKTGASDTLCPDFSKYLYFLFAPTLVYRDVYPRTQRIRWSYVVSNFTQVVACLFYTYYIFERFCVPVFRNFNQEHITPRALILSSFGCMLPGTLVLFIAFFAVLHSWLNAFAEMLRFGDRLFYKDWWNSSSFASYYRTWNVVVHDWLYSYIYRDVYKLMGSPKSISSRPAAMASVFLLSAVFHEYILIMSFGFFYPVLFVMFAGAGFGFIFLPNKGAPRSGNVFMWVALFMGNGMLMCLYSMEWYARRNCPPNTDNFLDYLIPRSWFCDHPGPSPHPGT